MQKAILDRFEDKNLAVLLVGEQEKEFHVNRELVPSKAKESSHLLVCITDNAIVTVELDEEATAESKSRIQRKMDRLREQKNLKKNTK